MITVRQLTRRYGDFTAVDAVDFQIGQGEIVGLLGHNGAGKTTIMKMLTGFLEPSRGSILVDGTDINQDPGKVQQTLGYLPENLPLYPEMIVIDYLEYAATLRGLTGQALTGAVSRAIRETELAEKALQPVSTLSRGYKQRVGVAQAILHSPKVLILDEPTNGLDPTQTQQMRALIKQMSSTATVILSTHIMQEVDALCDRVLILRNGKLALDQQMDHLRKSNRLILETSAAEEKIREILYSQDSVQSISTLEQAEGKNRLVLVLQENTDPGQTAAEILRQLVANDCTIYSLAPEQRDLETVFREVNSVEEVSHAA